MSLSPTPRRTPRTSRLGLAVATLIAAGTFAAAVAVAGLPVAPTADASVSAPAATQVVVDRATGERVVLDTVYVVTPAPAAAAAPVAPPAERHEGDDGHEGDHENESEGGDD